MAAMILAGVDEAGYGPLLGPLVVGCSAFEVEGDPQAPLPCLWKKLRKCVSRNRLRTGRKLHVNDSKLVYSPAGGLRELERGVLGFVGAMDRVSPEPPAEAGGPAGCLDTLEACLGRVCPDLLTDLPQYPWYDPASDERFPLEQERASVQVMVNALRLEMQRTEARCVHLHARVVLERQFNRLVNNTRNKASALFSVAAIHLDQLLRKYGSQGLVIVCDRQGGRERYGSLLRLMFDQWDLTIEHETDGHCEYRLRQGPATVRLIFCEKAEAQAMPVALASMLSKYLREALMRRFNAFWRVHLPEVAPTAGYYGDGGRFLQDIQLKRRELGIRDEELVRCR